MKKTLLVSLALLTSNCINANSLSNFDDGSWLDAERFSISVTAGKSRFNYDNQDYDSGFEEEYGNHFKQSSTHIAVSLGYEINKYFTASINYQNLGEYSGTKAFSHGAEKFGAPTTGVSSTVRVAGGGAAITAQYPITDSILPYARLGVLAYEAKQTNSYVMTREDENQQTVHRLSVERPIRDYKQSTQYALGINIKVSESSSVFIELQNSELDLVDFGTLPNVESYNVGVTAHF